MTRHVCQKRIMYKSTGLIPFFHPSFLLSSLPPSFLPSFHSSFIPPSHPFRSFFHPFCSPSSLPSSTLSLLFTSFAPPPSFIWFCTRNVTDVRHTEIKIQTLTTSFRTSKQKYWKETDWRNVGYVSFFSNEQYKISFQRIKKVVAGLSESLSLVKYYSL